MKARSSIKAVVVLAPALASLAACTAMPPALAPAGPEMLRKVQSLAQHPCNATTASVLEANRIDPARVQSLVYSGTSGGGMAGRIDSYIAWVGVSGEAATIHINLDTYCRYVDLYR
ncbi:MAG: hypothetical protein KIT20_05075 [Alphaproteobacteria bacterium]|nr:hypothetical protein [Alphaproteobacteria bacterium]